MYDLAIIGLCIAASALLIRWLGTWHPPKARFHDLTRPHEFLHQRDRAPNNALSITHYEIRRDALGHGVRPARGAHE